jgi:hypothetical protein
MGKTHSKPLAAQHGRGMVWARHAMCESAYTVSQAVKTKKNNFKINHYPTPHMDSNMILSYYPLRPENWMRSEMKVEF